MADISYLQNEDVDETSDEQSANTSCEDEPSGHFHYETHDAETESKDYEKSRAIVHSMQKLQYYAKRACDRKSFARILVDIFRNAIEQGTELDVADLMEPVHKLIENGEPSLRHELIEQLPHVAMICQEAPERFGNVLSHHIVHIIAVCHHDADQQIRRTTHTAFLTLVERGLLDKGSIEFVVAPTLLMMGQQPAKHEYVTLAIDGMSKVSSLLEPATAERLFLQRYLSLCRDENFFIRKLCAIHFGEFSAAMTKETMYNQLLPMYVTLCKDTIWTVRKSCAEVIVSVACCVSLEHRKTALSEILAKFLDDESKWVRLSAYQILGPFISTFAKQFTGFAYNQYGELVMTDQYGTELRYNMISFAGSADSSISCKPSGEEEYENNAEMLNSSMPVSSNQTNVGNCSLDQNKENVPIIDLSKVMWNKEYVPIKDLSKVMWNDNNSLQSPFDWPSTDTYNPESPPDEHHCFNPFLYYYIPPDLELDEELVKAATRDSQTHQSSQQEQTQIEVDQNHADNNVPVIKITSVEEKDKGKNQENAKEQQVEIKGGKSSCIANDHENNKKLKNEEQLNTENELEFVGILDESYEDSSDTSWKCLNDTVNISKVNTTENEVVVDPVDGQTIVPQILVDFFVSMADPEGWWIIGTTEIPRFCAFYFPAVVLTLGKKNWTMLKAAYEYLSDAREYKVRRTMASSIHEVAMILGEELSAQDLLPIYDGFIKDLDEVRIGALKHLATFLKVLKPADRSLFLPRLKAFLAMDNEWNWRFREEVASRFLESIPLFSQEEVSTHIAPLSFSLLVDKVAAVRHMAVALVTQILSYLSTDEKLVNGIILELSFILSDRSSKWTCRQTFALLCASLINSEAISSENFARDLLPSLLFLSGDKVPNVRLAVIRTLTTQVLNISNTLGAEHAERIDQIVRMMRQDPDRDVRAFAGGIAGKYRSQWP